MTVKNPEVAATGPSAFIVGFSDVHNDGDSVLIVVFDKAMEGVDCIALDGSIGSLYKLDRLYFRH